MAAGNTVEEQIIDDVLSSLEAIDGTSIFNYDLVKVQRQDRNIQRVFGFPCAIVLHLGTTSDDSRLGLINNTLRLGIICGVQTDTGAEWPQKLSLIASDVQNKLRADVTRGGGAVTTRITNIEIFDQDEMGGVGVAAAQLTVEVVFRHMFADTTTSV